MNRDERIGTILWHFCRIHRPVKAFVPVTSYLRQRVLMAQKRSGLDQVSWAFTGGLSSAFITRLKQGTYRTISVTSLAKVNALIEATDKAFPPKGMP